MGQKTYYSLFAKYEEPLLTAISKKIYVYVHPDMLTLLSVFMGITSFLLYLGAYQNRFNYLIVCGCVCLHYFFDGTDGKVAKLRNMNRKIGCYAEKLSDGLCSLLFIGGFFFSATYNAWVTMILLFLFGSVYSVCLYFYFSKNVEVKFGGTEGRIILVALNIIWFLLRT